MKRASALDRPSHPYHGRYVTRFPPGQRRGLTAGTSFPRPEDRRRADHRCGWLPPRARVSCAFAHRLPGSGSGTGQRADNRLTDRLSVGGRRAAARPVLARDPEHARDRQEDPAGEEERGLLARRAGRLAHGLEERAGTRRAPGRGARGRRPPRRPGAGRGRRSGPRSGRGRPRPSPGARPRGRRRPPPPATRRARIRSATCAVGRQEQLVLVAVQRVDVRLRDAGAPGDRGRARGVVARRGELGDRGVEDVLAPLGRRLSPGHPASIDRPIRTSTAPAPRRARSPAARHREADEPHRAPLRSRGRCPPR